MTSNTNEKEKLIARCEMGDVAAMMGLSDFFLQRTSETCQRLEADYAKGPEQKESFRSYLKSHPDERQDVLAGNMWLIRASLYGHPDAKRCYSENPVYDDYTLLPVDLFVAGRDLRLSVNSERLRNAGFSGLTQSGMITLSSLKDGTYFVTADAGTEGPDEDGFGMEELYDFYQYDEFFHLLHSLKGWSYLDLRIQKVSPFAGKREEADRRRAQYWAIHKEDDGAIQYVEQSRAVEPFMIRDGILVKCLKSDLSHAEIPYGVEQIGDGAFFFNRNLTSVSIPDSVTTIGTGAFAGCIALADITLPNSIRTIGENAFEGCASLPVIHIPSGVTILRTNLFCRCRSLKEIDIADGVTEIQNVFGKYRGSWLENLKIIRIPASVTVISRDLFHGFATGKNSVTIIGKAGTPAQKAAKENKLRFKREGYHIT